MEIDREFPHFNEITNKKKRKLVVVILTFYTIK